MKKIVLVVSLVFLVLALAFFLVYKLFNLNITNCGTVMLQEYENDEYVARLVEINCGATTGYNTVVNIGSKGTKYDLKNTEGTVFSYGHEKPKINLKWDNNSLVINCGDCKKNNIYFIHKAYKSIKIDFVNSLPE